MVIDPRKAQVRPGHLGARLGVSSRICADLITGMIGEASVRPAAGRGSKRILTVQDAAIVAVGKRYRDSGVPPGRVKRICNFIRDNWDELFPPTFELVPITMKVRSDGESIDVRIEDGHSAMEHATTPDEIWWLWTVDQPGKEFAVGVEEASDLPKIFERQHPLKFHTLFNLSEFVRLFVERIASSIS